MWPGARWLVLAGLQAQADEAWRDAEPGKILHELRTGELARTGQIPHTPYYGTVDATPLFLMLAGGYFRWTLDLETMVQLRPALDAALAWIDEFGDRDGDGFVEYERRSPAGLVQPRLEGLPRLRRARRRVARGGADSARRGAGLRVRREAADRGRLRGTRGSRACGGAARAGRRSAGCLQRGVLGPGGAVLRARAGRPKAAGAQRHVQSGALPVLRDRRRRQGRARRRATDGARHVLRLGHQDRLEWLSGLQPDELPQRLGLAPRQRDRRRRPQALRL